MTTSFPSEPALFHRARTHATRLALTAPEGSFSYAELLRASEEVARVLLAGAGDLEEGRVAFLVPPSFRHVAIQWGIWRAGGIAVPLALSHPPRELDYVLEDAGARFVVTSRDFLERVAPLAEARGIPLLLAEDLVPLDAEGRVPPSDTADLLLPALGPERRALMIYTSGTTGRPKGAITSHSGLEAQVTALVEAWSWSPEDRILLILPLHHVHGIVNVLTCALWSGACCDLLPAFDPAETWRRIEAPGLTLFMAVPTVYARLLTAWEAAPAAQRASWTDGCRRLRLMVSGSAALPVSMLERWREVSGHTLLERYGMTEIGMALSNPLVGERRPGFVGTPLPRVEIRLIGEGGEDVPGGTPGEIFVRGPNVFREYWNKPEATEKAFRDGWFQTGDMAVFENGSYRILGRSSVDIIKTAGFKVSALEIEEVLRSHPQITDCAVVALPDPEYGERVAAALIFEPPSTESGETASFDALALRNWAKEQLAPYKAPSAFLVLEDLPRNAMGKVVKPEVQARFETDRSRVVLL
jgi:malonyl-CoA/methylmalonyl-CoA synthetase